MKKNNIKQIIIGIIFFITILILFSTIWTFATYGDLKVDELIFHLRVPLNGLSNSLLYSYIIKTIIPSVFLTLFFILINISIKNKTIYLYMKIFKKTLKLKLYPIKKIQKSSLLIMIIIFLIVTITSMKVLNILDYLKWQLESSNFIKENYVDPRDVTYTFPEKKRNLIYIMVESLEASFFSKELGGNEETNLMPEIYKLSKEGINFSNTDKLGGSVQIAGTGWTVAGILARTSGLPLKIPIDGNSYGKYSKFLPGVYSLGQILADADYNQVVMMGSDSSFAGRNLYYKQHGNYEIWDYNTAKELGKIPNDYYVWWGFEDEKLYGFAKEKLNELSSLEQPFNFSLLTADTHHIGGYVGTNCPIKYQDDYSNAISCASYQLYNFINWIKDQEFYDKTTIVISGDHSSMDPYFFSDYDESYERTVFNLILNSPIETSNNKNRLFSTIDLFPTTLAVLDIKASSNVIGLGTNLFSGEKTLIEKYGVYKVNEEFTSRSDFYNETFLYK